MQKIDTCKNHKQNPIPIYNKCVGCELKMYSDEIAKLRATLEQVKQHCENESKKSKNAFNTKICSIDANWHGGKEMAYDEILNIIEDGE